MKKLDFIMQVLVILGVSLYAVVTQELLTMILIFMILGVYQPISAVVRLLFRKEVQPKARGLLFYYFLSVCIYFIVLGLLMFLRDNGIVADIDYEYWDTILFVWFLITPIVIASFYIYICYVDAFPKLEKRSKFLPNINL